MRSTRERETASGLIIEKLHGREEREERIPADTKVHVSIHSSQDSCTPLFRFRSTGG